MGTVSGKGTTVKKAILPEISANGCGAGSWRRVEPGQKASRPSTHASAHRKEIHRLKQVLPEKTLEVDFFKSALQKIEARRQRSSGSGEMASTTRSER